MRIGVSLPLRWLAGETSPFLPAAPPAALAALRAAGVTDVELRSVNSGTMATIVRQAAHTVWAAGLGVTVHGVLPRAEDAAAWPELAELAADLRQRGERAMLTVHACQAVDGHMDELAAETVTALQRGIAAGPFVLALELNRDKPPIVDPATDYDRLLAMVTAVGSPDLGLCWDFGHCWRNVQRGVLAALPPPAFVARVRHTHIHDLSATGSTHWPLTEGRVPLAAWVNCLLAAGYQGIFNLELSPERFAPAGDAWAAVLANVARLSEAISVSRGGAP